jgi:enoyl-CoA hydratase/carnithine racemase
MNTLTVHSDNGITVVHLARPPVNAISREMVREIRTTFEEIGEDRATAAVVLAAEGDRAFSAGIDLRERSSDRVSGGGGEDDLSVADLLDSGRAWRDTQHAVRHCPVPVIVAVDGAAIGAGFGLVGCCDIIFASPRAEFGLTEINVGLLGGSSKALRMVGPFKARTMFFTGDLVPAAEFYRLGVIEEIVEDRPVEDRAIEFARKLVDKSPIALRLAKESILRIEDLPMEDAYRLEQDYTQRLRSYHDSAEAMKAFAEKRPPTWTWS